MRVVNEWNLGLHRFASDKEAGRRFSLDKVSIAKDHTAATCGRAMVKVDLVKQDDDVPREVVTVAARFSDKAVSDTAFLIESDLARRLAIRVSSCQSHLANHERMAPGVAYVRSEETAHKTRSVFVIPGEDEGTLDAITTESSPATYPNVDKVIPEGEPLATVDLNGKLLGEILRYLGEFAEFDQGRLTLSLYKDKENDCVGMVKVEATNRETRQKAVSVVMPFCPKD